MLTHRFQSHVSNRLPTPVGVSVNCAFVPCPMFHTFPAMQQAQVQEIYRIAAEKTRQQLRRRSRLPQFSQN